MDYGKTLNLPKTKFPMRANLPKREPKFLEKWEREKIYEKSLEVNKNNQSFILHDGPPYANGDIHLGHTLNKILKDIIVRYKSLRGYYAPYVPGWDTHGLPIELKAIKEMGLNQNEISPVEFRNKCRDYALSQVEKQKEQFKRLGVTGDWENPYLTLNPEYEARQIEVFGEMAKKGYIYKGLKPVYWCPSCETALAEAEIEYSDHKSHSIYVKFRVKDDKGLLEEHVDSIDNTYFVIWTTTPWTLPANLAIAVGPEFDYSLIKVKGEYYIIAKDLVETVTKEVGIEEYETLATFKGTDLEHMVTRHPFMERDSVLILADHVTLESGTGCVHTAPGHGQEDFEVGQKYDLDVLNPVNNKGHFTELAGKYEGLYYKKANKIIIDDLEKSGALLSDSELVHSYPHCWRCKGPVIFRATEQWFASVDAFKDEAVEAARGVEWIPGWGEDRIINMVVDRADWCISRQRTWGVPIPIFYCKDCGKELINEDTIKKVSSIFREKGSNAWYELTAEELLPENIKCECGSGEFRKEMDIMDVWFDSGSSHSAVLDENEDLSYPADLYLEGNDQYRGWFQSSLLTAIATKGKAPYKGVVTHGMIVDGEGRKMSKSLGNGIDPLEVVEKYGADILRLWVSSADYKSDVRMSNQILKQLSEVYRKIRNTARFILGNLKDFNPKEDSVKYDELLEIDKWALIKMNRLIEKVTKAYDNYDFHVIYHAIHNFCVVDMSNFYLDIIKDRLYTQKATSKARRAAQTVMFKILNALVKMLAPILPFTSEEIWQFLYEDEESSVHLTDWPKVKEEYYNDELEDEWKKIISYREDIAKALEKARAEKIIGHSLNALVKIYAEDKDYNFLAQIEDMLREILIVSKVELYKDKELEADYTKGENNEGIKVVVEQAPGEKCERCWVFSETVGKNDEHPTICSRCIENLE
ncbi:isoleucine--tRNA ligase [Thermohalobacter berrensis]|uniref:Isoleucine--tRNA ligase n=1 Tax=Thermohalobacter berrensis TaxID=99594 RepID=A0A419TA38_9FIRM|nr:isoleucine--tRNA ligase [Thermohalobacter berrensis]RKD34333.1 isoleucine--tRNA ligase [Thermohalobacter berrensis]